MTASDWFAGNHILIFQHRPPNVFIVFNFSRWAVSSVMTRQNQIPTEDGSRVTLALIPLWDMCNHTNGLVRFSSVLLKGLWLKY